MSTLASTSLRACYTTSGGYKGRSLFSRSRRQLSSAQNTHEECDIVIVGGGPAGLALASALGSSEAVRQNLRVTLVDAGDLSKVRSWSPTPDAFSNRVVSLTNFSQSFLKKSGAWPHVEIRRTSPVEELQVWDGMSDARINFSSSEIGLDAPEDGMARLTEILNLQRGLLRRLEEFPDIQLLDKTKVKTIICDTEERGGWPMVHLDTGRILRARLLIGADGSNSPVRAYAQIPSFGWSYDTQGIVATMIHPPRGAFEGPNTTSYQRFLPTGPIAFLPLSPTVSSLVWSMRSHIASALIASGPDVMASMINAAFRLPELSLRYLYDRILEAHSKGTPLSSVEIQKEILWREKSHAIDSNSAYASAVSTLESGVGVPPTDSHLVPPQVSAIQPGTIASFPLRFNHTESYLGEGSSGRTVLIGDAAHTIHPLAGQGLNLGFADAECLARCIQNSLLDGGDVGSYTALLPYARERYIANHTLMSAVDKLHKLYSNTTEPVVWARSVGVEVLNELDSIKAALMMVAGAQSRTIDKSTGWDMAAQGVESLAAGINAAKNLSGGISGLIGTGLNNLLKASSRQRDSR